MFLGTADGGAHGNSGRYSSGDSNQPVQQPADLIERCTETMSPEIRGVALGDIARETPSPRMWWPVLE